MPLSKSIVSKIPKLSRRELVRYRRQIVLPEVGMAGQRSLKASSALVVGIGGLGNSAASYLAAAGVGRIGLVDGDIVEDSNLNRQPLFSESDLGRNKAVVAKEHLLRINPNVDLRAFPKRLDSSNAANIISEFNVIVDSTDNPLSRYLINDACILAGKPDVYASALRFDGQASIFYPPKGPCYRCLYPQPPPPDKIESCEEAGVIGVLPGIMGTVQALQAISVLLGKGSPLIGRLLVLTGLDSSFEELRVKKDPQCPACGPKPEIEARRLRQVSRAQELHHES
jgi:adenylyltransferase/sulfurtransferase